METYLFCRYNDNIGIQYHSKEDAGHPITALHKFHNITIDWSVKHYCGLTLNQDYDQRYVNISMPGYINNLLNRLIHLRPVCPVDAPHIGQFPNIARPINQQPLQVEPHYYLLHLLELSNQQADLSSFMHEPWIRQCCQASTKSRCNNLNQPPTRLSRKFTIC